MYGSTPHLLTPTLGFAHNLSHTIIREAQEDDDRSVKSDGSDSTTISISDEELALLGAPWAKEGMLCRKHFTDAGGKRAKDKSWMDVFVVIQKGDLNMFTFGDNTAGNSGAVGGGNWLVITKILCSLCSEAKLVDRQMLTQLGPSILPTPWLTHCPLLDMIGIDHTVWC